MKRQRVYRQSFSGSCSTKGSQSLASNCSSTVAMRFYFTCLSVMSKVMCHLFLLRLRGKILQCLPSISGNYLLFPLRKEMVLCIHYELRFFEYVCLYATPRYLITQVVLRARTPLLNTSPRISSIAAACRISLMFTRVSQQFNFWTLLSPVTWSPYCRVYTKYSLESTRNLQ